MRIRFGCGLDSRIYGIFLSGGGGGGEGRAQRKEGGGVEGEMFLCPV